MFIIYFYMLMMIDANKPENIDCLQSMLPSTNWIQTRSSLVVDLFSHTLKLFWYLSLSELFNLCRIICQVSFGDTISGLNVKLTGTLISLNAHIKYKRVQCRNSKTIKEIERDATCCVVVDWYNQYSNLSLCRRHDLVRRHCNISYQHLISSMIYMAMFPLCV